MSQDAIDALSPDERLAWDHIYFDEYGRMPYRWIEGFYSIFHYPSIVVLAILLKQPTINPVPMYFITGTTYVAISYFFIHRWTR
jgi:hypothetical protein